MPPLSQPPLACSPPPPPRLQPPRPRPKSPLLAHTHRGRLEHARVEERRRVAVQADVGGAGGEGEDRQGLHLK